jgi:hypothetical protein
VLKIFSAETLNDHPIAKSNAVEYAAFVFNLVGTVVKPGPVAVIVEVPSSYARCE